MTKADREAAKARCEKATSGPWSRNRPEGEVSGFKLGVAIAATYGRQMIWANPPGGSFPSFDADFIAHSRADVPALIADCEALIEALRKMCKYYRGGPAAPVHEKAVALLRSLGEIE